MVNQDNPIRQSEGDRMQHFGIDRWVDFARGLANEQESAAMREHLASGCSECAPLADFFTGLTGICRRMTAFTVPDRLLRQAYRIFPAQPSSQPKRAIRIPV